MEGPQGICFAAEFCTLLKKFCQLFDAKERHQIVCQIVLNKENFEEHIGLKIFADICLEGGMAFDVTQLWTTGKYTWLAFILLNVGSNQ